MRRFCRRKQPPTDAAIRAVEAPPVSAEALAYVYDAGRGLRCFDLEIAAGECVALLGHNGSGKTTALECIAGLLRPTSGSLRIGGIDPMAEPEAIAARRALAFVGDAPVFYRDFTVLEHLHLVGAMHGVVESLGRRAWEAFLRGLVDEFGLAAYQDALPHQLSAGLRQRTQLACVFARPFGVLVLDEPTLRLDPAGQALLAGRVKRVSATGGAVLVATHAPDFAREVADRLVILEDGEVVACGPWSQVIGGAVADRLGFAP